MLLRDRHSSRILDSDHGDWRSHAACADHDPELFHLNPGENPRAALAICATCPVIAPCRAWADEIGDDDAILGGTTPKQRRKEAARQRQQSGPQIRRCRWCRGMFMTQGAQYCGPRCREQAAHAMRSGGRQHAREETHA